MKNLVYLIFIGFSTLSFAQEKLPEQWDEGYLVVAKGDTLIGKIHLLNNNREVGFKNKDITRIYHFKNILSFWYYDTNRQVSRFFSKYPSSNKDLVMFERIVIGKYHYLRKLKPVNESGLAIYKQRVSKYYLWDGKKLEKINNFYEQLKPIFIKHKVDLDQVAGDKKFDYAQPIDQFRIMAILNAAIQENQLKVNFSRRF